MQSTRQPNGAGVFLGGVLPIVGRFGPALVLGAGRGRQRQRSLLVLVVVVVVAAVTGGRVAGAVAAITAALSFDFFHTTPYLSLTMDSSDDVETTVLLLIVGVVVGTIAGPRTMGAGTR